MDSCLGGLGLLIMTESNYYILTAGIENTIPTKKKGVANAMTHKSPLHVSQQRKIKADINTRHNDNTLQMLIVIQGRHAIR